MGKLWKQCLAIGGVTALFTIFDLGIYTCFTQRCIENESAEFQAKSVEVSAYLPFAEETAIVKQKSSLQLSGELPVLDGAAALFPLYSAFASDIQPILSEIA